MFFNKIFVSILLILAISGSDSVTIQITNMCTTDLVLDCDDYDAVELTPTQVFGFNYSPDSGTVTKCKAKCKQKTTTIEFDVWGGRAPSEPTNYWEVEEEGIFYVKKVKYYLWS